MKRVQKLACVLMFGVAGAATAAETVTMVRDVPYADDAEIQRKVREECTRLQGQLADFTKEFGCEAGVQVQLADSVSTDAPGRVLQLEITEAVSLGNPFIGHQKYTRVKGALFEDGRQVAAFKGMRTSMGGAFGGYKGSCSVLGRTVKALGKDIAFWLADPKDGAELGDY